MAKRVLILALAVVLGTAGYFWSQSGFSLQADRFFATHTPIPTPATVEILMPPSLNFLSPMPAPVISSSADFKR